MLLTTIFYHVDNFCNDFEKHLNNRELGKRKPGPKNSLSQSEVMTILIYFHHSRMRTFKDYYKLFVQQLLRNDFPSAPSYNRFIELMPQSLMPLHMFLSFCRLGTVTGTSFIDSTKLPVCDNRRIYSHKVFKDFATRGKTSTGWFYGFKLHIIINEHGEVIAFDISTGSCDDRNDKVISRLTKNLYGSLFGDRGYISSKLFKKLYSKGIRLFTKTKKKMKDALLGFKEKLLLNKRGLIESVNDLLKSRCLIDHTRHRSKANFFINVIAGLIAYSFLDKKPSIVADPLTAITA